MINVAKLRRALGQPAIYEAKTRVFSLGRRSAANCLRRLAPDKADLRVLDVGCGTGRHSRVFDERVCYVGVDRNADYIIHARDRYRGRFWVMDAIRLGFDSESFDFVFSVGLHHHLSCEESLAAAAEMKRVTKRGGVAAVIDAVLPSRANLMGRCLCGLDRGEYVRPLGEFEELLAREGFRLYLRNIPGSFPYQRAVFLLEAR
jgi:SAM-dependent methyltransferase